MRYGFVSVADYKRSPLITSSLLSQFDMTKGSLLEEVAKDYLRLKIFEEFGIPFDRYVELPKSERIVLKAALDVVLKERNQNANNILGNKK